MGDPAPLASPPRTCDRAATEERILAAVLEAERGAWGDEATRVPGGDEFAARPCLRGATLLLVAGVQYLLMRSRKIRVFGGVDLHRDEGWDELKRAIDELARRLFAPPPDAGAPPPR